MDSIDWESLYCAWSHPAERIRRHQAFEGYVLNEVLPFMAHKNPHPCTIAHGASLGAFHAVNIAFRHPHLFHKVAAFSGRYDLTLNVEHFQDLFGGHRDDLIYFHTPIEYLPNLECPGRLAALRRMDIVLVVGDQDPFLDNNRCLSRTLWGKGIGHVLHEWQGRAHQGHAWRRMAPLYV